MSYKTCMLHAISVDAEKTQKQSSSMKQANDELITCCQMHSNKQTFAGNMHHVYAGRQNNDQTTFSLFPVLRKCVRLLVREPTV